ncbi:MAG: hypothetical protein R2862_05305 [Thermoanaerobaculia bacterium]
MERAEQVRVQGLSPLNVGQVHERGDPRDPGRRNDDRRRKRLRQALDEGVDDGRIPHVRGDDAAVVSRLGQGRAQRFLAAAEQDQRMSAATELHRDGAADARSRSADEGGSGVSGGEGQRRVFPGKKIGRDAGI